MAKILYIHQYYQTRRDGVVGIAGTRSYEFAKRFAESGHEVIVIASETRKKNRKSKTYFTIEKSGVKVFWIPVPYSNNMTSLRRIIAFANFAIKSTYLSLKVDCDLVFATSTPLTVAIPALVKKLFGTPYVFEVRDLWPEAPIAMGVVKNRLLIKILQFFEWLTYRYASAINTLSPGMEKGVKKVVGNGKRVTMIPNNSDLDLFYPDRSLKQIHRRRLMIEPGDFACIYFGTFGPANGLDLLVDTGLELYRKGNNNIKIILHGDGKEKKMLMERVASLGLSNVFFSSPLPNKEDVADMVSEMNACLVIYKNIPALQKCSPNKLFDALAAGKPIVTNMDGWISEIVTKNDAGKHVITDSPIEFANVLIELSQSNAMCHSMGLNARRVAEKMFARDQKANELLNLLNDVIYSVK